MGSIQRLVCALCLAMLGGSSYANDFYWKCTTSDGIQYADATQCDKGDVGVQVMKAGLPNHPMGNNQTAGSVALDRSGCHSVPAYCARPDFGLSESATRAQAITHFMRRKECAFLMRSTQRCVISN